MSLSVSPIVRRLIGVGIVVGLVAVAAIASGASLAEATHVVGGGHQGTPAILGVYNDEESTTVFAHKDSGCAYGADDGIAVCSAPGGTGVDANGLGEGATGVFGEGAIGVWGDGATGVRASTPGTGTALQVFGKATFTRSGKLTITAGKASTRKYDVALTPESIILATVQNNIAGVWVTRAVQATATSFLVYLNKAVPSGQTVTVGWFVVN